MNQYTQIAESKFPCKDCICLSICKGIYNGYLHKHLHEYDIYGQKKKLFKRAILAKARILLSNHCKLFNDYLYSPSINGSENMKREKVHHIYFVKIDKELMEQFQL